MKLIAFEIIYVYAFDITLDAFDFLSYDHHHRPHHNMTIVFI